MTNNKTLRLLFPQWQGGTMPEYYFGSRLLEFLAPKANGPVEEVPVDNPIGIELKKEDGINGRAMLLRQLNAAQNIIEKYQPDSIVILGGDCLVDLAPFAYLNERYSGELGVLWVDAHPDVMSPEVFTNAHAMVLGNLLGEGDKEFTNFVKQPLKSQNVLLAGLGNTVPFETAFLEKHTISSVGAAILNQRSDEVIEWIKKNGIKKLAVHFDLDVMSPTTFHSIYFSNPSATPNQFDGITQGKMKMEAVLRLITDVAKHTQMVGLGITEFLPWDAINLHKLLAKLPLIGTE